MPSRPSHRCIEPGCTNTTKGQRCTEHGGTRKGTAAQRGYDAAWRLKRTAYLKRHPFCVSCQANATVVDHIKPRRLEAAAGRDPDRWENLESMCVKHHNAKTGRGQ